MQNERLQYPIALQVQLDFAAAKCAGTAATWPQQEGQSHAERHHTLELDSCDGAGLVEHANLSPLEVVLDS